MQIAVLTNAVPGMFAPTSRRQNVNQFNRILEF